MQNRLRASYHRRHPQLPLRAAGQERQIPGADHCETYGKYAADGWVQPCDNDGSTCESDTGVFQRARGQPVRGAEYVEVDTGQFGCEEFSDC